MDEALDSLLLIGAEVGAVLILGFIALVVYFIRRRASDKRYVTDFIADHKSKQEERRSAIKTSMQADSLLIDEDLENFLNKMGLSEKHLYRCVLNMFLGFDRKCFSEIRTELLNINNNWIDAVQKSISNSAEMHLHQAKEASGGDIEGLNKQLESLTADNKKMASELAEAMETMEDIVKEYSLMYAGQENQTMERLSKDYDELKKKSESYNSEET
ncbi:MAG: hypothetical protein KAT25_01095 [Sulfuriflexus sp.]|nr:hypothetical protein [Sulfuriflexus sp.]